MQSNNNFDNVSQGQSELGPHIENHCYHAAANSWVNFPASSAEKFGLCGKKKFGLYTVKKGSRVSRLQPGCH